MTHDVVRDLILKEKLIVIFRRVPIEKIGEVARALVRGGIRLAEVTFDQQAENPCRLYADSLTAIRGAVGGQLCLGAGTVLTTDQVIAAEKAGAQYIISPNTKQAVIKLTRDLGLVSIPGAMTPSEIVDAWDYGADLVKLFPADDLGYHYIWNIRGPLPHIPLLATGGVNPHTISQFFEHGVSGVGTGVSILDKTMLANNDYDGIQALAKAHVDAIRACSV